MKKTTIKNIKFDGSEKAKIRDDLNKSSNEFVIAKNSRNFEKNFLFSPFCLHY